ncbi:hypothetical protein KM043_005927 [Ampulex compressa]|nr:hypothetical protein KM043_005927 [Ampulex compressa]
MSAYDTYEQDVNYATEQTRTILRMIGIWPAFEKNMPKTAFILKIFSIFVSYSLLLYNSIPGCLYYIYGVEHNARIRLKHSILVLYATMTVIKYSCLLLTQNKIKDCIDHVRQDWKVFGGSCHRQAMIKRARVGRRFFLFSWALMYVGAMCYRTIVPLSVGKIVVDENTTIRPLSAPAYFIFFDVQKSPAYEIVFVLQVFSGFVACTITITLCGLMSVFVMHACGQLDVLEEVIKDLVHIDTVKKESLDGKLAIMVEHQIRVQQFVQMVEVTLQECSLIEVLGCTTIVCLLGYAALMEWEDGNSTAVFSFLTVFFSISFNIFALCYIGDQLTIQADKVAWTSCTLEWYRISGYNVRSLVLVMAMSSASMKITAGKFICLSVKTFGDVLKTAAAYLNMLRTVTE